MAVTEKRRHELIKRFEETLGPEHAETMMELLPPVGWADVATKQDLGALRHDLDLRFDLFEERMASKADLQQIRRDVVTWVLAGMGIQTAVVGLLVSLA